MRTVALPKICGTCKQNKIHKLMQSLSNPPKLLVIIINRFDNNNRKLNNVMCISESININSYQVNLKAFIHHYGTT